MSAKSINKINSSLSKDNINIIQTNVFKPTMQLLWALSAAFGLLLALIIYVHLQITPSTLFGNSLQNLDAFMITQAQAEYGAAPIKRYIPITESAHKKQRLQNRHNQQHNVTSDDLLASNKKNLYTYSSFGRVALKEQTRLIVGMKFLEGCEFDAPDYAFKPQQAVQFIFRNENPYMIHLIFSERNLKTNEMDMQHKLNEDEAINFHHIRLKPHTKKTWSWQFNHKKQFDWLCYNEDLELKGQVGISVK